MIKILIVSLKFDFFQVQQKVCFQSLRAHHLTFTTFCIEQQH